jgi:hypothetical protein
MFTFFLFLFSVFTLISIWNEMSKALTMIAIAWVMVFGFSYISLRLSRNALEEYSKIILNDLEIRS